jgi:hypothetical protein
MATEATLEKTFTFTVDREAVEARAAASKAMTPQERCRAMMRGITSASSRDIVRGRAY